MEGPSLRRVGIQRAALVLAALTTIGCDRVTKHLATAVLSSGLDRSFLSGTVRLVYSENTGGFLSLGASLPPSLRFLLFTVGTGAALAALFAAAVERRHETWSAFGLMLFAAGGLSNWLDRIASGRVVDFLNVGIGPIRTGIFNVADMAILAGALVALVAEWRRRSNPTS